MSRSPADPLRALFREEAEKLAAETAATGESPPQERLDTLARLGKLLELRGASRVTTGRNWKVASALAATLAVVTLLLFLRVRSTEIELDLLASQVRFALSSEQVLTSPAMLPSLGFSGVGEILLPRDRHHDPRSTSGAVRLAPSAGAKPPGSVTLGALTPPAGTRVTVRASDLPGEYRLSLAGSGIALHADLQGAVTAAVSGSPTLLLDLASPARVLVRPESGGADLDLTLPPAASMLFVSQLQVSGLVLHFVDESAGQDRTLLRQVSTILSGTLYLEALDGVERRLRAGEPLEFAECHGILRQLKLADNRVAVQFHGVVSGMTTGSGEGRRSLMPTWLEWLRARHGLLLLWGSVLYLFGLLNRAMAWWGFTK